MDTSDTNPIDTMTNRLFIAILVLVISMCNPMAEKVRSINDADLITARDWSSDLLLPTGATGIFAYEKVGGTQDLERFYRFNVHPSIVNLTVEDITSLCEIQMKKVYKFERDLVVPSTFSWPSWAKSEIIWWRPDSIVHGIYKGTTESYGVRVWADLDIGTIFVYQSD